MKTIPNYQNYKITKTGRVWSKNIKRYIIPWKTQGYYYVSLCKNGVVTRKIIHRLVLETYVGKCPKGMECRHLDGNKLNNKVRNLRWGTRSENTKDRIRHGVWKNPTKRGELNGNSKLSEIDVRLIYNTYWSSGCTQTVLANKFKVYVSTISFIVKKKTWKHLWEE